MVPLCTPAERGRGEKERDRRGREKEREGREGGRGSVMDKVSLKNICRPTLYLM